MLAPPIETGADKAKDADSPGPTQLPLGPLVAQPTMPALNADKQDTSLEIVHATAKDAPEQTSSTSTTNSTPMKNWNLLTRSPKSETNSTR